MYTLYHPGTNAKYKEKSLTSKLEDLSWTKLRCIRDTPRILMKLQGGLRDDPHGLVLN